MSTPVPKCWAHFHHQLVHLYPDITLFQTDIFQGLIATLGNFFFVFDQTLDQPPFAGFHRGTEFIEIILAFIGHIGERRYGPFEADGGIGPDLKKSMEAL